VLQGYETRAAAKALGLGDSQVDDLEAFRRWLIDRLTALGAPER
jgi:hypothetical protein